LLNVADLVVFTGYVPGSAEVDHMRLADSCIRSIALDTYRRFFSISLCGVVCGARLEDAREPRPDARELISKWIQTTRRYCRIIWPGSNVREKRARRTLNFIILVLERGMRS